MNASKEEARKALELIQGHGTHLNDDDIQQLIQFLEASVRKLPSEETYQRQKQRKRTTKKPVDEQAMAEAMAEAAIRRQTEEAT